MAAESKWIGVDQGGKPLDALQRQVALAALDPAHVCAMDPEDIRESLLTE